MTSFYKTFLMYGVIFASIWLILDYVRGDGLSDWWLTILTAFVGSAIGATLLRGRNRRFPPDTQ